VVAGLAVSSLLAQDFPKSGEDSFDVEPPLLIQPRQSEQGSDSSDEDASVGSPDPAKLAQRLEGAKKNAAAATRLVRIGVLAKVEAEQRALRVVRLTSELANAQLVAAQEQLTAKKARLTAKQATQAEVDAAAATLAQAQAAAKSAEELYHKAQLDAATVNLRRQQQLLKLGSAHKSDVTRAQEKLAQLQQNSQAPH
jgi:hypothetical protein